MGYELTDHEWTAHQADAAEQAVDLEAVVLRLIEGKPVRRRDFITRCARAAADNADDRLSQLYISRI
jgi:hypothetical protein